MVAQLVTGAAHGFKRRGRGIKRADQRKKQHA